MSLRRVKPNDTWRFAAQWLNPIPGSCPPIPDPNNPVDITGYSAQLQMRASADDPAVLTLTSEPGEGLTVDGPNGLVTGRAAPALTLPVEPGQYQWEVEVFNDDDRQTLTTQVLIVEAQISQ